MIRRVLLLTTVLTACSGSDSKNSDDGQVAPEDGSAPVGRCDSLGAVGVWENITPAGVDLSGFGMSHISIAPNNPSTLFASGDKSGIYKSIDCGASWVHVDTGTLGAEIDTGTASVVIDPSNPDVLYTGSLYGLNGFFKSTNGGVDFAETFPPDIKKYIPYGGFIGGVSMDPSNPLHLLVAFHDKCAAPYNSSCYVETTDGAKTWVIRNGEASWNGGEGSALQFLTSDSWLFSSSSNGMWSSTDHGAHWTQIPNAQISHGAGQLYRAPNGSYFLGSATGVLYSANGSAWETVPGSGNNAAGVVGDGTTVWTGMAYPFNPTQRPTTPAQLFRTAQISAPTTWTTLASPSLTSGGTVLAYDPDRHILYSTNYWEGVYRVVVK